MSTHKKASSQAPNQQKHTAQQFLQSDHEQEPDFAKKKTGSSRQVRRLQGDSGDHSRDRDSPDRSRSRGRRGARASAIKIEEWSQGNKGAHDVQSSRSMASSRPIQVNVACDSDPEAASPGRELVYFDDALGHEGDSPPKTANALDFGDLGTQRYKNKRIDRETRGALTSRQGPGNPTYDKNADIMGNDQQFKPNATAEIEKQPRQDNANHQENGYPPAKALRVVLADSVTETVVSTLTRGVQDAVDKAKLEVARRDAEADEEEDPFEEVKSTYKTHRLKHVLRAHNDAKRKIDRLFLQYANSTAIQLFIAREADKERHGIGIGEKQKEPFRASQELFKGTSEYPAVEKARKVEAQGGQHSVIDRDAEAALERTRVARPEDGRGRLQLAALGLGLGLEEGPRKAAVPVSSPEDHRPAEMMADEEFQKGNFRRIRGVASIGKAGVAKHHVLVKLLEQERGQRDTAKANELMITQRKDNLKTNARKVCAATGCCHDEPAGSPGSVVLSDGSSQADEDEGHRGSDGGGHSHAGSEAGDQEAGMRGPPATKSKRLRALKRAGTVDPGYNANRGPPLAATKAAAIEQLRIARTQDTNGRRGGQRGGGEGRCRACNRSFSSGGGYSADSRADGKSTEVKVKESVGASLATTGKTAPHKCQTKQQELQALREQQRKQAVDNEQYADIKIPPEFIAQFEIERGFAAGDTAYASREIQDEIRIRYLSKQYKRLEEFHEKELKEQEVRLRHKMHAYARACLQHLQKEMTLEYKCIFVELDLFKESEQAQAKRIRHLEGMRVAQDLIITELSSFVQWEQIAHDQFTGELMEDGLTEAQVREAAVDQLYAKGAVGVAPFYDGLRMQTDVEREAIDLTKPFGLYTSKVRLNLHEKLNLLERETVCIYRKKVNELGREVQFHVSQNNDLDEFQTILAMEKKALENNIHSLECELYATNERWCNDKMSRDNVLKATIREYEKKLEEMAHDADELHDIFARELEIKDMILGKTNDVKELFMQRSKELTLKLRTPRLHMEFLKDKGKLDEFVAAKLTKEECVAKWLLLDTAKDEISTVEQETKRREEALRRRKIDEEGGVGGADDEEAAEEPDTMEKAQRKYIITSSFTRDLEAPFQNDRIYDLNFCEVPAARQHDSATAARNAPKANELAQWNDSTSIGSISAAQRQNDSMRKAVNLVTKDNLKLSQICDSVNGSFQSPNDRPRPTGHGNETARPVYQQYWPQSLSNRSQPIQVENQATKQRQSYLNGQNKHRVPKIQTNFRNNQHSLQAPQNNELNVDLKTEMNAFNNTELSLALNTNRTVGGPLAFDRSLLQPDEKYQTIRIRDKNRSGSKPPIVQKQNLVKGQRPVARRSGHSSTVGLKKININDALNKQWEFLSGDATVKMDAKMKDLEDPFIAQSSPKQESIGRKAKDLKEPSKSAQARRDDKINKHQRRLGARGQGRALGVSQQGQRPPRLHMTFGAQNEPRQTGAPNAQRQIDKANSKSPRAVVQGADISPVRNSFDHNLLESLHASQQQANNDITGAQADAGATAPNVDLGGLASSGSHQGDPFLSYKFNTIDELSMSEIMQQTYSEAQSKPNGKPVGTRQYIASQGNQKGFTSLKPRMLQNLLSNNRPGQVFSQNNLLSSVNFDGVLSEGEIATARWNAEKGQIASKSFKALGSRMQSQPAGKCFSLTAQKFARHKQGYNQSDANLHSSQFFSKRRTQCNSKKFGTKEFSNRDGSRNCMHASQISSLNPTAGVGDAQKQNPLSARATQGIKSPVTLYGQGFKQSFQKSQLTQRNPATGQRPTSQPKGLLDIADEHGPSPKDGKRTRNGVRLVPQLLQEETEQEDPGTGSERTTSGEGRVLSGLHSSVVTDPRKKSSVKVLSIKSTKPSAKSGTTITRA